MSPERQQPDIIKIIDFRAGFTFEDITLAEWEEESPAVEYNATVGLQVLNAESMLLRCERAWQKESGIFLEYPGFRDGLLRTVRITDCVDNSEEDQGVVYPAVLFRVVLTQDDYDDYISAADIGEIED